MEERSYIHTPRKMNVFGGILESACQTVGVSVYVPNTNFCQSAGGGIKSHSVTALVHFAHRQVLQCCFFFSLIDTSCSTSRSEEKRLQNQEEEKSNCEEKT